MPVYDPVHGMRPAKSEEGFLYEPEFHYSCLSPLGWIIHAQFAVTVSPVKTTGQKAMVALALKNNFIEEIESARAVCVLPDEHGKVVGQSTKWVLAAAAPITWRQMQPTASISSHRAGQFHESGGAGDFQPSDVGGWQVGRPKSGRSKSACYTVVFPHGALLLAADLVVSAMDSFGHVRQSALSLFSHQLTVNADQPSGQFATNAVSWFTNTASCYKLLAIKFLAEVTS